MVVGNITCMKVKGAERYLREQIDLREAQNNFERKLQFVVS